MTTTRVQESAWTVARRQYGVITREQLFALGLARRRSDTASTRGGCAALNGRRETRKWVNGFKADFYWPDLGLVVETDGLRYHRTTSQQRRGLERDQTHLAAGMLALRFSHGQIRYEPDYVRAVLRRTAARALAAADPGTPPGSTR